MTIKCVKGVYIMVDRGVEGVTGKVRHLAAQLAVGNVPYQFLRTTGMLHLYVSYVENTESGRFSPTPCSVQRSA